MNKRPAIILSIFTVLFILFLIIYKPFTLALVKGSSMEPTIKSNQLILLERRIPQRGDVVIFKAPKSWDKKQRFFIKRVVGITGDKITVTPEKLYVNNAEVVDFKKEFVSYQYISTTLKDEYFVIGDNIGNSDDSIYQIISGNSDYTIKKENVKYSTEKYNHEK